MAQREYGIRQRHMPIHPPGTRPGGLRVRFNPDGLGSPQVEPIRLCEYGIYDWGSLANPERSYGPGFGGDIRV